jgi:hypothetical protein
MTAVRVCLGNPSYSTFLGAPIASRPVCATKCPHGSCGTVLSISLGPKPGAMMGQDVGLQLAVEGGSLTGCGWCVAWLAGELGRGSPLHLQLAPLILAL